MQQQFATMMALNQLSQMQHSNNSSNPDTGDQGYETKETSTSEQPRLEDVNGKTMNGLMMSPQILAFVNILQQQQQHQQQQQQQQQSLQNSVPASPIAFGGASFASLAPEGAHHIATSPVAIKADQRNDGNSNGERNSNVTSPALVEKSGARLESWSPGSQKTSSRMGASMNEQDITSGINSNSVSLTSKGSIQTRSKADGMQSLLGNQNMKSTNVISNTSANGQDYRDTTETGENPHKDQGSMNGTGNSSLQGSVGYGHSSGLGSNGNGSNGASNCNGSNGNGSNDDRADSIEHRKNNADGTEAQAMAGVSSRNLIENSDTAKVCQADGLKCAIYIRFLSREKVVYVCVCGIYMFFFSPSLLAARTRVAMDRTWTSARKHQRMGLFLLRERNFHSKPTFYTCIHMYI